MTSQVSANDIARVLQPIKQSIASIEEQVAGLQITTATEAGAMADLVKAARTRRKKIWDEDRRQLTDPLNDQVKWINDQFKPECEELKRVEQIGKEKLTEWQRYQDQVRRAEQERQRKAEEEQRRAAEAKAAEERRKAEEKALAEAEEAAARGDDAKADAILAKASETPPEPPQAPQPPPPPARRPPPPSRGSMAGFHKRRVRKVRVVDWSKVPGEFLELKTQAALTADRQGREVPGLEFYDDEQTVVS